MTASGMLSPRKKRGPSGQDCGVICSRYRRAMAAQRRRVMFWGFGETFIVELAIEFVTFLNLVRRHRFGGALVSRSWPVQYHLSARRTTSGVAAGGPTGI